MNKEMYERAEMDVIRFTVEDVLTVSDPDGDYDLEHVK